MLAHIVRKDYADTQPKKVELNKILSEERCDIRCATLVEDHDALYRVLKKVIPHLTEGTLYGGLIQILGDLDEKDWELLLLLNKELYKLEFLEKRFAGRDNDYLALKFLGYRNMGRQVGHYYDPLEYVEVLESNQTLHKYMLSRTISFFGMLLERMDEATRHFAAQETPCLYEAPHYEAFPVFVVQALVSARPAENFADMDLAMLREHYLELENRVLVNYAVFDRTVLLPCTTSETIIGYVRLNTVLASEFLYSVPSSLSQYVTIQTCVRLLHNVFRLHADLLDSQKYQQSDNTTPYCATNNEPSKVRWLDILVPYSAHIHVLLKESIMPEFCVSFIVRKQPELNIPVILGKDEAGVPCILTPSTNKVTSIVKKLYGIADHDRLVPLSAEDSILMNPEATDFPDLLISWVKKRVNCVMAYCGRTDIVSYIKELPENRELPENNGRVSSDALFHKFYIH